MQKQGLIRVFLFVVFFSIGAATMSASILCNDLLQYYHNRQFLKTAEDTLKRLESLNADYDALLRQVEHDPNSFNRIASAALGRRPADVNTVAYPEVTAEQLTAARRALDDPNRQFAEPVTPGWLGRCCTGPRRTILFFAGAFLVLISFVCFSPAAKPAVEE